MAERYLAGFSVGVGDAVAGIAEPDGGYPTDPEWVAGMMDGRLVAGAARRGLGIRGFWRDVLARSPCTVHLWSGSCSGTGYVGSGGCF